MIMRHDNGMTAIGQWRNRFLGLPGFHEDDYQRALLQAQALEHDGVISTREWIELVRQANQALMTVR